MIVFGGGTAYQSGLRQKECLGEVRVLNLDDLRWSWVKCGGDIINPRRSHASEIIGKNMIVHGGLNYKGSVLGDLWLFDMGNIKKNKKKYLNKKYYLVVFPKFMKNNGKKNKES